MKSVDSKIIGALYWDWCEGTEVSQKSEEYQEASNEYGEILEIIEERDKKIAHTLDNKVGAYLAATEEEAFIAGFKTAFKVVMEAQAYV